MPNEIPGFFWLLRGPVIPGVQGENRPPESVTDNSSTCEAQHEIVTETEEIQVQDESTSSDDLLAEAIELHNLGVNGDKEAVQKCYELLQQIRETNPDNVLAEAYFGSATSLLGRDAIDPNKRFKLAIQGVKILDQAVSKAPDNIDIRTLRGYVCLRLPELYFHRTATAIEDFTYLVSRYEQDQPFSTEFYWKILFDLGVAYKQIEQIKEAEATWRKLLSAAPDPKYFTLVAREGMEVSEYLPETTTEDDTVPQEATPVINLSEGTELRARALAGDQSAVKKALAFFQTAHEQDPSNSLIEAYYGDSLSLSGRHDEDPTVMFGKAIQGMKIIDHAVTASPDNIEIRLIRAYHSFRLPEAFFRRTATAIADFEYLRERYNADKSIMSKEKYWQLLYDLGRSYQRLNMEQEARDVWLELLSKAGDQELCQLVKDELNFEAAPKLQADASKDELLKEGIRFHDLAVAGNQKAAQVAVELFGRAFKLDPQDPLIEGYYGSSLALAARDSTDTTLLFGNTIKGLKHLKQAIARDWNNPRLHLLRGYLCYNLPESFFHLSQRAAKDLRFVKVAYEQDNSLLSQEAYWQLLYDLGVAYKRSGDYARAEKTWEQLLEVSLDPKFVSLVANQRKGADDQ
ncbi:MAG: tetratricopeptide repeat protein [bacterium]